ncbi:class I SAM-dependent methyltransferase [Rhodobacteraceae bacterium]|nr:class I SAM-dependent methyltransferase [Paracoccaceae bacterium]
MRSEAENIIGIYRRHAQAWAERRGPQVDVQAGWLDRFLDVLPEAATVLDIGCGSGTPIGRYLLDHGCCLTGIDASQEMIQIASEAIADATWIVSDMRSLCLDTTFEGLIAWDSFFHLTPQDQRRMFPVFRQHAAEGAVLMFTSGPNYGETMGTLKGEALYHASLDGEEYRALLAENGFAVLDHVVEDPDCGRHTVWLAQKTPD